MKELAIQAEVGRRLRNAIGRTHARHALRLNSSNDELRTMVDDLVKTGIFTPQDGQTLMTMSPNTVRTLHKQFVEPDLEPSLLLSHDQMVDFAHAHRPKAMRRELPEHRAARNARALGTRVQQRAHGHDAEAEGMVPPKMNFRRDR